MAYNGHGQPGYERPGYDYGQQRSAAYAPPEVVPHPSQAYATQAQSSSLSSGPNYRWWIPADGIRRDVITADIQRYLGPDALVKPGEGRGEDRGRPGYWIAAYRTLTPSMLVDLRNDSAIFEREGTRGRYEDSRIHESRQHHGSTDHQRDVAPAPVQYEPPALMRQAYSSSSSRSYQPGYGSQSEHQSPIVGYGQHMASSASPAQDMNYTTNAYGSRPAQVPSYSPRNPDSRAQAFPGETQATPRGYAGQPPPAQAPVQRGRTPPGFYLASNGQYYPVSQQPGR